MQTECLYSSPKAGLNAVLGKRRSKWQTLAICMPMNDRFFSVISPTQHIPVYTDGPAYSSFVSGWLGGTTGSASDQRSEGCGFEAY